MQDTNDYAATVCADCVAAIDAIAVRTRIVDSEGIVLGLWLCLVMSLAKLGPEHMPGIENMADHFARTLLPDVRDMMAQMRADKPPGSEAPTTPH